MDLTQAIQTRASIREFNSDPVSDAEITALVTAACQAPSWANTQVWEFVVIRDSDLIDAITATYSPTNPAARASRSASALIVVCARQAVSGYRDGRPLTTMPEWYMFDLGLTCENLSLTAHDLGLGTVIVGLFDQAEIGRLLELPTNYQAVVVMPLGHPAKPGKHGPSKKSPADCCHLNRFGQAWPAS